MIKLSNVNALKMTMRIIKVQPTPRRRVNRLNDLSDQSRRNPLLAGHHHHHHHCPHSGDLNSILVMFSLPEGFGGKESVSSEALIRDWWSRLLSGYHHGHCIIQ